MKMRRGPACVPGVADGPDNLAFLDEGVRLDELRLEMGVIMNFASRRTCDPDDIPAETVGADARDEAVRGRHDRRSARREDVDAMMGAAALVSGIAKEALDS